MKLLSKSAYLLLPIIFLISCFGEDVPLRPDSNDFHINYPGEGEVYPETRVFFNWVPIRGAEYYNITVSSITEGNNQTTVLDTAVYGETFTTYLNPGEYLFSYTAINSLWSATSGARLFFVDTTVYKTPDLDTLDTIVIVTPIDSAVYDTASTIIIWWETVEGASGYELVIMEPSFLTPVSIVLEETIRGGNSDRKEVFLDSGSYQWGIRAYQDKYDRYGNSDGKEFTEYTIQSLFVN